MRLARSGVKYENVLRRIARRSSCLLLILHWRKLFDILMAEIIVDNILQAVKNIDNIVGSLDEEDDIMEELLIG